MVIIISFESLLRNQPGIAGMQVGLCVGALLVAAWKGFGWTR